MSQITLSGLGSGLDTSSIINSLVSVEQQQQTLLSNRKAATQKTVDAYTSLMTAVRALADQARDLAATSGWAGATATSSSTSVTATARGSQAGSISFDVNALAAAHSLVTATGFGSITAQAATGSTVTLTTASGAKTLSVGTGSLSEVVNALNAAGTGVRAAAVQLSPGNYRLQVSATSSGEASEFTLTGLNAATQILAQGADAQITVGDPLGVHYDVSSTSNTFDGVVPGLSFTVGKLEDGVTVSSSVDGTAVATDVKALVDAANAVLSTIATQTAYSSSTKSGGPLLGQSAVRQLQQSVLSAVGGTAAAGISLTRGGRLAFDQAEFVSAFRADPAAVAASYGASVSLTPAVGVTASATLIRAGDATQAGSYPVTVSQTAQREQWTVDATSNVAAGAFVAAQTVTVSRGTVSAAYTAAPGETLQSAADAINIRSKAVGLPATAVVVGNTIIFTAAAAGTAQAFTVATSGGSATAAQSQAGRDIAGSIDGVAATGTGEVLAIPPDAPSRAAGLSVSVITAATGAIGTLAYQPGVAQKLAAVLSSATATAGGTLTTAQDGLEDTVKTLQEAIDDWDTRLETYRLALVRQFAAMESTLSTLKSQNAFVSTLDTSML